MKRRLPDWALRWGAGLILIAVTYGTVYLPIVNHRVGESNHANIVTIERQSSEIKQQGVEIKKLLNQHTGDIANESTLLKGIKKSDAELGQFAAWIIEVNEAQCAALHSACPAVPKLAPLPK